MLNIMHDMNPKGNCSTSLSRICMAFVFGDHLGFTAGVNKDMIFPSSLAAGCCITALILANLLAPKLLSKIKTSDESTEQA
jgi:ethanolamine transporter